MKAVTSAAEEPKPVLCASFKVTLKSEKRESGVTVDCGGFE